MAKKNKGHKMASYRKWLKIGVNGIFKVFGVAAMLGPASGAITNVINTKDISHVGGDVIYGYLGIGSAGVDTGKLIEGVGSVAGGLFLFWLGGQVAKRV